MSMGLDQVVSDAATWLVNNYERISLTLGCTVLIYFLVPFIFYICPKIQKLIVFQHWVNVPFNFNFRSPAAAGLIGGRNFYINPENNESVTLGVWHLLPHSAVEDIDLEFEYDPAIDNPQKSESKSKIPVDDATSEANSESKPEAYWDDALVKFGKGIILYFHGNTGTRALPHRVELYDRLQELDFHVISVDYRGFADSTNTLADESKFIEDATAVYCWVVRRVHRAMAKLKTTKNLNQNRTKDHIDMGSGDFFKVPNSHLASDADLSLPVPIFVWGHSLGTGISVHMVSKVCSGSVKMVPVSTCKSETTFSNLFDFTKQNEETNKTDTNSDSKNPETSPSSHEPEQTNAKEGDAHLIRGLILESPFSNFADAVRNHRLTKPYRFLPGFHSIFVAPLKKNDVAFESDLHIKSVTLPTLILHAVDDAVIPVFLGQKLYEAGKLNRARTSGPIYFKRFAEGFGHKFICKSPQLPKVIEKFTKACLEFGSSKYE